LGRKEGDIKGSFVIDTGLYVTNYRYSAVSTKIPQAERNNIALRSHSGSIDVDLWLMPRPRESCVKIKIGAKAGITARLVGISFYFHLQQSRLIFAIEAYSK
jgi:hypothetical protein